MLPLQFLKSGILQGNGGEEGGVGLGEFLAEGVQFGERVFGRVHNKYKHN